MTPIRRQYLRIKGRYPDALVLFRLGDFYETFDDDARVASRDLDIVLTSKSMGQGLKVPLAGIPAHSLESYLARLIKKGHRVAVCEQLSDPAASKGLVERDVVRVVTPGTVVSPSLLEPKSNNYLTALAVDGDAAGLAYVDITTGEFAATQLSLPELPLELDRLSPAELLVPPTSENGGEDRRGLSVPSAQCPVTSFDPCAFPYPEARQTLLDHFGVSTLEGFGCEDLPQAVRAAAAVVEYLARNQRPSLADLGGLGAYSTRSYMNLDHQTRRNLELFQGGRWGDTAASLFSTLDLTRTPMGGRLLRRWLGQPLLVLAELRRRQDSVAAFHGDILLRERTGSLLSTIPDLERALNRVRLGTAPPRDLASLKAGLESAAELRTLLFQGDAAGLAHLEPGMQPCDDLVALIGAALEPEPAGEPGEGSVIREGFSAELDELRLASRDARKYIAGLEHRERESTGIRGLKVGYNKVFGYYIEVSNPNLAQVPDHYTRRQTLVGGERFITPELKEYESLILNARERIEELERALYRQVCSQIAHRGDRVSALGDAVAHVDVFACLAEAASRYGYVRPELTDTSGIDIRGGRHPVVERVMPPGSFVPNDTRSSNTDAQVIVLTGPNMAGKSTYIRQVAVIVLMAQIGSYVPADSATIGLVDRIFTRVGLQDDLTTGQSTFMIEMVETASILNQATPRSLVILDEIGRGTSTYDGLSIARAVVEHIHNDPGLGCQTLFATHYHELTRLAATLPRVRNYTVAVSEEEGRAVFLHRIVPGGADKSYGIHVAQLAGLPRSLIARAWEVLGELESGARGPTPGPRGRRRDPSLQMALFGGRDPALEELAALDVQNMTPLEAINTLYRLQREARENRPGENGGRSS
ncbi:MAG: DNA mismatch repair protein MutS [Dehalococcoidia bacterium]|nr:DNA mismatch repair protein MutS [Dehalococcoidia bacterium]